MITDLLRTVVADVGVAVQEPVFFSGGRAAGLERLGTYPSVLEGYVTQVEGEDFAKDMEELVSVLGAGESVLGQIPYLMKRPNALFSAYLDFLERELAATIQNPCGGRLGAYVQEVASGDSALTRRYARVLVKEAQTLLLAARGIASPEVQVATAPSTEDAERIRKTAGKGIVSLTVNGDLLGGARMFKDGTLKDASWRARLNQIISVIS